MDEILSQLRKLRPSHTKYISLLGELFHYKNAEELARLSLNPSIKGFVTDYISICCLSGFQGEYKGIRTRLEQTVQTQPKLPESPENTIRECKIPL